MTNNNIDDQVEYTAVIPVWDEEGSLPVLHERLTKVMQELGKEYEIIFVDDGSTDKSFNILYGIHEKDKHIKIIRFTRNFGQHAAIMAGFHVASGKTIITLDADLQNPPEEIPKLLEKLDEGYDVVFGVLHKRKHPAFRRIGSRFTKWVLASLLPSYTTDLSGFRALKVNVIDQLKQLNEKSKFLDGLICWMGFRIVTVETRNDDRYSGATKYTVFKLISLWMDMVVSLTDLPLKFATFGGLCLGLIALLLGLFYLIWFFVYGFSVPGFASTVILITFFSGVQLFALGILGEYIGRMNKEVKNKPEYIIRDSFN